MQSYVAQPPWDITASLDRNGGKAPSASRSERLTRFLSAYWLRPENALWMALRSETLGRQPLAGTTLDLCCGDGVFTFLHLGGVFDPAFDVFTSVKRVAPTDGASVDMYDCCPNDYRPRIIHPAAAVAVGADHKRALLARAARLNLYGALVTHDANQNLPFHDEQFDTVYCNAAYWIQNIAQLLQELRRVTSGSGRVVLQVKLAAMNDFNLEHLRPLLGSRVLEIIGGGRTTCWPTLADRATWEQRFAAAGLKVEEATPFITATHARLWDVGLRPIAPLLVRMAQAIESGERAAIKSDWVALFHELLAPLFDSSFRLTSDPSEPAEIQYVLSRAR